MADELSLSSPYLAVLERQRAELVTALTPVINSALIAAAQRLSARLSVRLDASPLDDATADAVDSGELPAAPTAAEGNGAGWAQVLKLDGLPTQDIAAAEYLGVRNAQAEEERFAGQFFAAPLATLGELQRHIVARLVDPAQLGVLRTSRRAVNDGAQGRVIFMAPAPQRLPGLLAELEHWLQTARDRQPPLVVAGVVHARILQWWPFEAGNGRIARAASRLALRATGGDPWGLAVPESAYLRDPLGYVTEIAATNRRGNDLRPWNERTGEAIVASLEATARRAGATPGSLPARAVHECAQLAAGDTITLPAFAAATDSARPAALAQLNRLCWAGFLRRDSATRGLRYVRTSAPGVR